MQLVGLYGDGPGLDAPEQIVALGAFQAVVWVVQRGDIGGVIAGIHCGGSLVAGAADAVAGQGIGHIGGQLLSCAVIDQGLTVVPGYLSRKGIYNTVGDDIVFRGLIELSIVTQVVAYGDGLAVAGVFVVVSGNGLDGDAALVLETEARYGAGGDELGAVAAVVGLFRDCLGLSLQIEGPLQGSEGGAGGDVVIDAIAGLGDGDAEVSGAGDVDVAGLGVHHGAVTGAELPAERAVP